MLNLLLRRAQIGGQVFIEVQQADDQRTGAFVLDST
jgi:hypothetical protein